MVCEIIANPLTSQSALGAESIKSCRQTDSNQQHPLSFHETNLMKQLSLHMNRKHIGGQNALVGIFTDIPNAWSCVISVLNHG